MKILEIRLRNLNSLKGEWRVDLTHPAFTNDGLFAVTGPTGAGKTTLFDAVCLALYGRTPRLGKISSESNEIMSRRTGDCLAQVTFSAQGETWLCRWGQRRAHGKERGRLQESYHELARAETGEILTSTRKETPRRVEAITGMDFERFTRAALLAQGRFDAFLKAGKDERAKTLEMITGTELYSRISQHVFARCKEERGKLSALEAQRGVLSPPSKDEEEAARKELENAQAEAAVRSEEHEKTRGVLSGLENLEVLQEELKASEEKLPLLREAAAEGAARLSAAEQARLNAREAFEREAPLLQKVRALDQALTISAKPVQEAEERYARGASDLTKRRLEQTQLEESKKKASEELERALHTQADLEVQLHAAGEAVRRADEELAQLLAGKLLREYRAERDALQRELMLQMKILSLEEERKQLHEGQPCPLCGSKDHPWAEGFTPEVKGTEKAIRDLDLFIGRAERAETNAGKLKEEESLVQAGLARSEGDVQAAAAREEAAQEALTRCAAELQVQEEALADEEERLKSLRVEAETIRHERTALYGQRVPDKEEERLRAAVQEAEKGEARSREEFTALGQTVIQAETAARLLQERLEQQAEELRGIMKDAPSFPAALESVKSLFSEEEKHLKEVQERVFQLKETLRRGDELRETLKELAGQCEAQAKEAARWAELNALIGSAEGQKYSVFAQKLTLDLVVAHANRQLQKMSSRYLLVTQGELDPAEGGSGDPLSLSVIDGEQAGEIRPTANLSGGESFIVSLALALGLSQLSGRRTRVDSLFLDEGFGALDDEALEMALEALGEVRREGRMIGIISHVQALKERIPTQIQVIPRSNGTSILSGPGCTGG
ncbi:MAG: AAA family ATPase [Fretibacterium sp.]|nr:AAA family ATPase [Fretibacterium sp.]